MTKKPSSTTLTKKRQKEWGGSTWRLHLGGYLRSVRLDQGVSLRQLAERINVSHSELFKIEKGTQDIRLDTFQRVFVALGVPPGRVLDEIQPLGYLPDDVSAAVRHDHAAVESLVQQLPPKTLVDTVSFNCAALLEFVLVLLRSSNAVRRARRSPYYPSQKTAESFVKFAEMLDALDDPLERQSLAEVFFRQPIAHLSMHGLLDLEVMAKIPMHLAIHAKMPAVARQKRDGGT